MSCTELNVEIIAVNTPASGGIFQAGSVLVLNCTVKGQSENLSYKWSVTGNVEPNCANTNMECVVDVSSTTSLLNVGKPHLYSYYAGVYKCTVNETGRPKSTDEDEFTVSVTGEL